MLQADVILGTSAGAIVGAQLGSGVCLADLYARQLSVSIDQTPPRLDVTALMTVFEAAAADTNSSIAQRLKMVGDRVVSLPIVATEDRHAMISTRLPSHEWPTRPLKITAIDVETGELVVFDESSGVRLVDAVAASCAVPAVWPPVAIGERHFMDGGISSSANVGVVANYESVGMFSANCRAGVVAVRRQPAGPTCRSPGRPHSWGVC